MDYQRVYDKLIALSRDTSTTPAERKAASAKAYHIHKKHLARNGQTGKSANSRGDSSQFRSDFRTSFGGNPFARGPGHVPHSAQFTGCYFSPGAMPDELKEQFKQQLTRALHSAIKDRDKLKQKGEL